MDHDRLAIMCVFGAAAGSIIDLISVGRTEWETGMDGFLTLFDFESNGIKLLLTT
jgi:hypothetical protein